MKYRNLAVYGLATALAIAPMSSAFAYGGYYHHGRGVAFGLGAVVGAVAVGAATIIAAPFQAVAAIAGPPAYVPPPPPAYYAPPQPVYYAPAPVAYYAPRPYAYYAPRPYYGY